MQWVGLTSPNSLLSEDIKLIAKSGRAWFNAGVRAFSTVEKPQSLLNQANIALTSCYYSNTRSDFIYGGKVVRNELDPGRPKVIFLNHHQPCRCSLPYNISWILAIILGPQRPPTIAPTIWIKVVDKPDPARTHQVRQINIALRFPLKRIRSITKAFNVIEDKCDLLEMRGSNGIG